MKTFLMLAMVLVIFSDCKKGADDPAISFRSRKTRISGEWIFVKRDLNDVPQIPKRYDEFLILNEDGSGLIKTISYGLPVLYSQKIGWEFNKKSKTVKNKESVIIYNVPGTPLNGTTYHIKELRYNKMVLETTTSLNNHITTTYYKDITQ